MDTNEQVMNGFQQQTVKIQWSTTIKTLLVHGNRLVSRSAVTHVFFLFEHVLRMCPSALFLNKRIDLLMTNYLERDEP